MLLLALARRVWIAVPVTALLIAVQSGSSLTPTLSVGYLAFSSLLFLTLLVRFGFVAGTAYLATEMLLFGFPVTTDMKVWYAGAGLLCLGLLAAVLLWGAKTSSMRRGPALAE